MDALTIEAGDAEGMIGASVVDPDDDRIGEIRQVFLDSDTEHPTWVGVRVGLLGAEVLVPLQGADWDDRTLHASVTRSSARSAPTVDLDEPLSLLEQDRLFRHYGIPHECSPRGEIDLARFDDADLSYSVDERAEALAGASSSR